MGLAKRVFDFLSALLAVAMLSPILLVIALIVFAEDRKNPIFRQERVGRNGDIFRINKFRTMTTGSHLGNSITVAGDTRVTKVGKFLRASHLDELPQLINVIAGNMSLVGPRPEVEEFVDLQDPLWQKVLSVRPGITSRETLTYREQGKDLSEHDNYMAHYADTIRPEKLRRQAEAVDKMGFFADFFTLLLTVKSILSSTRSV